MSIRQKGFTLVELIVVIVILGILAATALPRFINVTNEARIAAVNGVAGGLRSAATLVQAKWQAAGGLSSITSVSMVGGNVDVTSSGFPQATDTGIVAAMGCSTSASPCQGVAVSNSGANSTWTPSSAGASCNAVYNNAGTVTVTTTGC